MHRLIHANWLDDQRGSFGNCDKLLIIQIATLVIFSAATFVVAPRFKDAIRQGVAWQTMYPSLVSSGVRSITTPEAYQRSKKSSILLDVRLASKFDDSHPAKAVNVPLYTPIQDWDFMSNVRRAGFAFFGVYGTEFNEAFVEQVR